MPGVSVRVPEGLRDLMKSFAKEVLRQKPLDIYKFSSQYFESILQAEKDFDFKGYEAMSLYENVFMNGARREQNQVPLSVVCAIIPEELTDLIKEFIKAVLRANPNNICKFAVVYFRRLREQRHKTCSMQYKSYENYLQNMQRGKFAPYVRCTCGRVIGEGLPRAITRNGKSVEYQTKKTATEANASRTTNESESGDANTAKSNFDDEKYIKAVYILQRFFRRFRGKQRPDAQSSDSTTNNKNFEMTAETAAYVIQRTLRKFVVSVDDKSATQHEVSALQIESSNTSETASNAVSSSLPALMPADATVKIAETEGAGSSNEPAPEKHDLNNAPYLNSDANQSANFSEKESRYPAQSPSVSNNVTVVESSPYTIQHTDIKPSCTDAKNQTLSNDTSGKPAVAEDITPKKDSSLLESAVINPGSNSETINLSPLTQSAAQVSTEVANIIDQTSPPQLKLSTARLQPCQELSAPAAIHLVSGNKVPATSFNNFKTQTGTVQNTQPTTNNGSASEIELEYVKDSNESNNSPSKQADAGNATLKGTASIESTATTPEPDSKTSSHSKLSINTDSVENAKTLDEPHLQFDVSVPSENTTHLQEGPDFDKTSSYKNEATPDASNFFSDNKIESDAVMKSVKENTHHGTSEAEAEYQTPTDDISRKRRDTEHITFKRRSSIESVGSYPESDNKAASHSEFIPIINQLSVKESHIADQSPTTDLELEVSGPTVNTLQFKEDRDLDKTRSLRNVSIPATSQLFRNENKNSSGDLNIEIRAESPHNSEQNTLKSISDPEEEYQNLSEDISHKSTVAADGTAERSLSIESKDSDAGLNIESHAEDMSHKSIVAADGTAERSLSTENKDSDANLNIESYAESLHGSEQNTLKRISDPEEEYQNLSEDMSHKSIVAADGTAERSLSTENKDSYEDLNIETEAESLHGSESKDSGSDFYVKTQAESSHGSEQNTLKRISDSEEEYKKFSEQISKISKVAADVTAVRSLSAENKDSDADFNVKTQAENLHRSEQSTLKIISDTEEEYQNLSEDISHKSTVAADGTAERLLSTENKDSDADLNIESHAKSLHGSEQNTLERISDPKEEYQNFSEDISHKSTVAADGTAERSLSTENKDSDADLNIESQAKSLHGSEQNTLERVSDPEEEYQNLSEDMSHKSTVSADGTAEKSLSTENKDSDANLNIESHAESLHGSEKNTLKRISDPKEEYQNFSEDISHKSTVAADGTAERSLSTENKNSDADLNIESHAESLHGSEKNTLKRISDPKEEYQNFSEDISHKFTVAADGTAERSLSTENKDSDADLNIESQAESLHGSEQNTLKRISDPEEEYQNISEDISHKSTVSADGTTERSLSTENKDSDANLNIESHAESLHVSEQNTLKIISDPEEEYQNLSEDIFHKSTVAADETAEKSLSTENKDSGADLNIKSHAESLHGSEQNTLKRISDPEEKYHNLPEDISHKSTVAADRTAERSLSAENKDSDADLNIESHAKSLHGSEQNTLERISDPDEEYQNLSEDMSHKSIVAVDGTAEMSLSTENKDSFDDLNVETEAESLHGSESKDSGSDFYVKTQAESSHGSEQNTLKRISDPEEEYQNLSEDISHKSTVAADGTAERSLSIESKDSDPGLNIESHAENLHGTEKNTLKRISDPKKEYQNLSENIFHKSTVAADGTAERSLSTENKDSDADLNIEFHAESVHGSEQNTLKRISDPEEQYQNLPEDMSHKFIVAADGTAERSLSTENKDSDANLNIESHAESLHGSEQNTLKRISDPEEKYQNLPEDISHKSTVAADGTAEKSLSTEKKDSDADLNIESHAESLHGSEKNTLIKISDPKGEYQNLSEDICHKSTVAADGTAERSLSTENKDSDADLNIESHAESLHGLEQNTLKIISDPEEEYQNLSEDISHKSTVAADGTAERSLSIESTEMDETTVSHSGYAQSTGRILNGDANLVDHNFTTHLKLDPTTAQCLSPPIANHERRESTTTSNTETQVESSPVIHHKAINKFRETEDDYQKFAEDGSRKPTVAEDITSEGRFLNDSTIRQLDKDTPLANTLKLHEVSDLDETLALQDVSGSAANPVVSGDKNEYASVSNIETSAESPLVTKQHILNSIFETEEEYQSLSENLSGNPTVTENMISERRSFPDSTISSSKHDNKTTSHLDTTQSIDEKIIRPSLTSNLEMDVSAPSVNVAELKNGAYTHDDANQFLTDDKNDSTPASKLSVGTEQSTDNETSATEVEYQKLSENILKECEVPENRISGKPSSIESTVTSSEPAKDSVSSFAPTQSADQVAVKDTKRSTTYLELGVSTPPKDIVQLQEDTELDETNSHGLFGRDKNESAVALNIATQSESPLRVKRNTLNKTSEIEAEYQNHFENLPKNLSPESTSSLESTVTSPESHNKIASQSESLHRIDQISAEDANLRDESSATHLDSVGSASLSNIFQSQEDTDLEKTTLSKKVPSLQINNKTVSRLGSIQSKEQVPVEDGNPVDINSENSKTGPSVSDSTDLGKGSASENAKSNPSLVETIVPTLETNNNKIASHLGTTELESTDLETDPTAENAKSNQSLVESKMSSLETNKNKIPNHSVSTETAEQDGRRVDINPENSNSGHAVSDSKNLATEPATDSATANTKSNSSLAGSKVSSPEANKYEILSQSIDQVSVEDGNLVDKIVENSNTEPSVSESTDLETGPAPANAKSNPSLVESKVSTLETNNNETTSHLGSTQSAEKVPVEDEIPVDINPENSSTGPSVSKSTDLDTDPATENTKTISSLVESKDPSLETNNNKIASHLESTQIAEKNGHRVDKHAENSKTEPDLGTDPATAKTKSNLSLVESKGPSLETNNNKIASHSGSTETAEQNENRVDINPENSNTVLVVSDSKDLATTNTKSNSSLVGSQVSSLEANKFKISSHLESPQSLDQESVEDGNLVDKIVENSNTEPSVSESTDLETGPAPANAKSNPSLVESMVSSLETNNNKISSRLGSTQSAEQVSVEDGIQVDKNRENNSTGSSVSDSTDLDTDRATANTKTISSLVELKVPSLETNNNKIANHSGSSETAEQDERRVDISPENSNSGLAVSDSKDLATDSATANTKSNSSLAGSKVSALEANKYKMSSHLESPQSVDQESVEDGNLVDKIVENSNTVSEGTDLETGPSPANLKPNPSLVESTVSSLETNNNNKISRRSGFTQSAEQVSVDDGIQVDKNRENSNPGSSVSDSTDLETGPVASIAKSNPSLIEPKVFTIETNNTKTTSHLGSTQSEDQVGHRLDQNPENRNTRLSVFEHTDLERDPAVTNTKSKNYVLADNIYSGNSVADQSGGIEDKNLDATSFQVNLGTQDDHDFTVASDDNAVKNVEQLSQRLPCSEAIQLQSQIIEDPSNKVESEINMADDKIVHNATPVVKVSTTSKASSDAGDKLNDQTRTLQNNLIPAESSPMNAIHSTSSVQPVGLTETGPIERVAAETCIATAEPSSATGNALINRSIGTQNSHENHSGTNNSNKVDHSLKKAMKQSKQPSREYCIGIPLEARIAELHLKSFRTSDTSLPWYAPIAEGSSAGNNETESRSATKPRVTANNQTITKSDQMVNYDGSKVGSSNSFSEIDLKRGSHELSKSPLESATQETDDTTPTEGHINERMPTYLYGIHPPRLSPTQSRKVYKKPTAFTVSFGPTPTFSSELEKPEPELNDNEEVECNADGSELPHTNSTDDSRHLECNEVQMHLNLKPQTIFSDKIGETDLCHSEDNEIENMSQSNATSDSSLQNSATDVEHLVDIKVENGTTESILDPIIELNDGSNNIESTDSTESDSDSDSSWSMSKELDENISQEFVVKNVEAKEKHERPRSLNETEPHIKGGIYELDRNHLADVVCADNNNDADINSITDQAQNDKENSTDQIKNSSRSHTKSPYSPTPSDVQAKEAAASLIQKAFRKYIASRANQDDLKTSANSSWNSSQTTQIYVEHDLDKSLEDSSALSNDELNNKQPQPRLVSPTLNKMDHDQEQDEKVEDKKIDWFVGTELIQTSKVEQSNAKLHSNGVESLELFAVNNAELDKNIHPEMSVEQSAGQSAVDGTHIQASDEYREAFAPHIPQSDIEELGSIKKKSQSTGHEGAVPVANVQSVGDSDTNLTDIVETISTFLGSERTHTANVINSNNILNQKLVDNDISFTKDFFDSSTNLADSNVLYEKLEEDCIKRSFSPTYLVDDGDRSVDVEDESSPDDTSTHAQTVVNHAVSSPDREDDKVIVNRLQREDTQREDSAQSDCVVFGGSYEQTPEQLEKGVEPKILLKSVSYDDNIEYIEPTEFVSSPSLCLDDDTSENIRKQMMAYSLSEADSDAADVNISEMETKNVVVNLLDSNIRSALADTAGTSTETESTVVSATNINRANTGANEAISASMENSIETEAVTTIQRAYRKYQRKKQRPKILADAASSEQTMNLDSSLASRRMTLQRGNALRNDSAPDEENLISGNSKGRTKFHDNAKQQVDKSKPPADVTSKHNKKIFDNKLKWLAMRQNSMPVQIDSEVLRVIPKHMRKRIKSADGEKGRRRILKD